MFRIKLSLVYLIVFFGGNASAQLRCNLKHYSTEDGLSHDGILCITRDREGFMWFGTWDGITRFDGHNFVTYKARPGDSSSLKNNKIRDIVEDRAGYLWIKTFDNRVYRFDKKTEKFLAVPDAIPGVHFKNIVIDRIIPVSSGDTWLLTDNEGLLCAVNNKSSSLPEIYKYDENMKGGLHIPGNHVSFLYEDKQKRIWVGTAKGLTCMVKSKGKYRTISSGNRHRSAPRYSYTCVKQDKEMLYFGTSQGILVLYNTRTGFFSTKEIAKNIRLNSLCMSGSGILYISTSGKGLVILDPASLKMSYAAMPGFNSFQSIFEDQSGQIWLEPEKNGVIKYDPGTGRFKFFTQKKDANFTSPNKNYHVFEDANRVLWVSMKGGGFGYYNPDKDNIEYFYDEPGTAGRQFSNIVTALYSDHTGVLWLSTYDGGINRIIFPARNFNYTLLAKNPRNKSENEVRAICEDKEGKLWIGTKAGRLYVFKNGKRIDDIFVNMTESETGSVYTITEGRDGTIWLGTKGSGLLRAEPLKNGSSKYKVTRYTSDPEDINSISSNLIYSVLEDRKGRVWVGTLGGGLNLIVNDGNKTIFKNSNNSFQHYPIISCNVIRYLQEDSKGLIWIATTEGLVIFDPDKGTPDTYRFSKFNKMPGDSTSLGNNDVQFIYKARSGQMWVGTFGGGLNKVISGPDPAGKLKFKVFTTENGLPNDIILSIIEDKHGNLWLTTENGLSEYDPKQQMFRNYDSYDGLPESGFSEAACFRSDSGELFFGCIKGYISFDPDRISNRKFYADMALTNLQLYNKDILAGMPGSPLNYALNRTKHFTLNYDQDVVSIDYTVLDYRAGHKILYAYILKGYDKGWHYVKNQEKATYTNLPPGDYVFVVKSLNPDLFKNIPQKSIAITILPPPWRTGWAYAAYLILALILLEVTRRIVVTMIRLRNKVVVEQKLTELKLSFFTNISHELRTPLTLITSPLEEIERTENLSVKGREYIRVVSKNANRMVRFINQLLDFRKVQSGKMRLKIAELEIITLIKEISEYFTEQANEKNIELVISSDIEELYVWADEEKIDIIIYNLLSNAFKFTPSGKTILIEICCVSSDDHLIIRVTDQGPGVPKDKISEIFQLYYEGDKASEKSQKGTGIGLALSRELVLSHHGRIAAQNNPQGGMTFILEFKTGKDHFSCDEVDFVNSPKRSDFINSGYSDIGDETDCAKIVSRTGVNSASPVILIVEDNADLRKFLCNQLGGSYQVKEASDGEEGMKIALDILPDLILSDVMMPNMDGIQMLDQLKNNAVTSHIPIILLTARSAVKNQIEGLKYGADFYITKPFHIDYILASVESLIKQRKRLFESLLNSSKKLIRLTPDEILITSKDEQFLKDTIRIVEEGMSDPDFNIDSVATAIGMGRTTFYKKLKSLTGLAPVEFVRKMRLKRGKQLLEAGENTVSEIAYMIGFSNPGYFSTCFKEEHQFSPSDYLKEKKNRSSADNILV